MSLVPVSSYYPIPLAESPSYIKKKLIGQVALLCLQEAAVFTAYVGITSLFMMASITPLILTSVIIFCINVFARSRAAFFAYQYYQNPPSQRKQELVKQTNDLESLCATGFTFLDSITREPLVNEMGHAATSILLYKNAKPQIYIFPFKGRFTLFSSESLRMIGSRLGQVASQVAVIAMGSILALSVSLLCIVLSHKFRASHPRLSDYGEQAALLSLFAQAKEALVAMTHFVKPGNDFTFLWVHGGIHPLVCVATVVILPIILKLFILPKIEEQPSPNTLNSKSLKARLSSLSSIPTRVKDRIIRTLKIFPVFGRFEKKVHSS
ncbi:MAG: hypothetical protein WCP39_04705 [Chlamydiota bacterium]